MWTKLVSTLKSCASRLMLPRWPPATALRRAWKWIPRPVTRDERSAQAAAGGAAGDPTRLLAGQSEGDTSESYVAPASRSAFDDFYNQTGYGQQWLAMYKFIVPGVTNTGGVVLPMPQRF